MKFGIITFPGSNCDYDAFRAVIDVLGEEAVYVWHKDTELHGADVVILPGGFSYGDYLRPGAIARFSPIMQAVVTHAKRGAPVLGICNGFQIACEAGLLPGALLRNATLRFISRLATLRVENGDTEFTSAYERGDVLRIPVAHGDGRYTADADTLAQLNGDGQVLFRYCDAQGELTDASNVNGSVESIAGIVSAGGNVLGMMPHPERAVDALLGSADGRGVFESVLARVGA